MGNVATRLRLIRRYSPGRPGTAVSVCIRCGCDDLHACADEFGTPCHWVVVDHKRHLGVCSECVMLVLFGALERHT